MNKLIVIGDIHGRNCWKKIVEQQPDAYKFIFLGDYFDSKEPGVTTAVQLHNFKEIVAFKEENKDKVILLFGNHDEHYLPSNELKYTGYQPLYYLDIRLALESALRRDLMQACYAHENILFSHAGFTKTWLRNNEIYGGDNIVPKVNELFKFQPKKFELLNGTDNSGDNVWQGPFWVRPKSLYFDRIPKYYQVVGHTSQSELYEHNDVILTDTLGIAREYLLIRDWGKGIIDFNAVDIDLEEPREIFSTSGIK